MWSEAGSEGARMPDVTAPAHSSVRSGYQGSVFYSAVVRLGKCAISPVAADMLFIVI